LQTPDHKSHILSKFELYFSTFWIPWSNQLGPDDRLRASSICARFGSAEPKHSIYQKCKIFTERCLKFIFTNLIILLLALGIVNAEIKTITLKVRPKVEIDKKSITLGDVAEIDTKDEKLKELLMTLKLYETPPPGRTFIWDKPYLQSILCKVFQNQVKNKDNEPNSQKIFRKLSLKSLSIEGSKIIQISAKSREVLPQDIINKVKEFAQQKDLSIEILTQPRKVEVPPGEIELKIIEPGDLKKSNFVPLSVQILIDKKVYTTIPILLKLNSSQVIASKANDVMKKDSRVQVKPGDFVILIVKIKSIEVKTLAKVLQKGSKGELIRVMNVDSKKILFGEVIDQKRVRALVNLEIPIISY